MKTNQKMDYFQKDKMALYLYIVVNQEECENKHQKMKSGGFF